MSVMAAAPGRRARPGFWTVVFFAILALFLYVTVLRFARGLGR
jgi:cytochrome c1